MKNKKRQYRSNQGRSPEKESRTFKAIYFALKFLIVSSILMSIIYVGLYCFANKPSWRCIIGAKKVGFNVIFEC
jgi:hypothetical protein